ncbi:cyclic nucleotide-binding domain-containing protein, partial [Anaplasma marginale]|uniref:cyclic nucleotide-binding domain-containing protein n=1 Tax=Anaplasma marginale TaxID=770 RepID=UPI001145812D
MRAKTDLHQIYHEQIIKVLGESLSSEELSPYLKQIEYIAPKVGRFWQTNNNEAGVYLVLKGKVRILDRSDNLIATLEEGSTFGECTFFPDENFAPYSIRTSLKVQLAYFPSLLLFPLITKHPIVLEHFHRSATRLEKLLTPTDSYSEDTKSPIDPSSPTSPASSASHAPPASSASHAPPT